MQRNFYTLSCTFWRRCIGYLKRQVSFCKKTTHYRALLWKMTNKDEVSCASAPFCSILFTVTSLGARLAACRKNDIRGKNLVFYHEYRCRSASRQFTSVGARCADSWRWSTHTHKHTRRRTNTHIHAHACTHPYTHHTHTHTHTQTRSIWWRRMDSDSTSTEYEGTTLLTQESYEYMCA